ncbi:MAG TPA: hypothetical protein VFK39_08660 [Gemmatimonadaceae bacterium]|nr:hypothetical protein [Gemmatimonadaceae bacterium]
MRRIPLLVVPVTVLCAALAATNVQAQVPDSAAAARSLRTAASLLDRVAADSTPDDSAAAWLQEAQREVAAAAPALDEKRRAMVVLWVESLLRNELARVRVLEAVRRPDSSTVATAAAAVDSAETNFFNCDIGCTPRDYRALMHLSEARTRLDSLLRARRKP